MHLPYDIKWYWANEGYQKPSMEKYFNLIKTFSNFDRFADEVISSNEILKESIADGGKYSFNISGTFIEQCKWNMEVISSFHGLLNSGNVELLASPYYQSVCSLFENHSDFIEQVKKHSSTINDIFDEKVQTLVNTQLLMSDEIARSAYQMGFRCMISEGSHNIVRKNDPVYVYKNHLPVILRHINLSEDIERRFSEKKWTGYPLIADKFAAWVNSMEGDVLTLYINYDSLSSHRKDSELIHDFIRDLPKSLASHDIQMITPSEAVKLYSARPLETLKRESTARYGINSLIGNHVQHIYMHELTGAGKELENIKDRSYHSSLQHIYRCLQQSSIMHDMNAVNYPLAYERAVNNLSILSDLKRALISGDKQ
nr:glycoside hydrolase family 57 protein [Methanosalsum zhilinae]